MTAYTEFSPAPQHFVDGAEDLHMGEIVSPRAEAEAFLSKLDREDRSCARLRNAVCIAFERERLTAKDAIEILMSENIWGNREYFMAVYAAGVRALAERLPDQPASPTSPTPLPPEARRARSMPSEYLLDVLAPVRERRVG